MSTRHASPPDQVDDGDNNDDSQVSANAFRIYLLHAQAFPLRGIDRPSSYYLPSAVGGATSDFGTGPVMRPQFSHREHARSRGETRSAAQIGCC
jgi:hypothetical protein